MIDILNSNKSKEETIEDVKRELLLGQLKRNIVVTHEIASLLKEDTLIDAEGLRILAYTEDVLKVYIKSRELNFFSFINRSF